MFGRYPTVKPRRSGERVRFCHQQGWCGFLLRTLAYTFFATKNFTVKYSAFIKVVNRYGNMKRRYFLHGVFFLKSRTTLSSFQK